MSIAAYGNEEIVGFGVESTFGTPVTPTHWLRPIDNNLVHEDKKTPLPHASGYPVARVRGASAARPNTIQGLQMIAGGLTFAYEFDVQALLLKNAMTNASNAGYTFNASGGTEPEEHVFDFPTSSGLEGAESLTIVRYNGQEAYTYAGCMIDKFVVNAPDDGPLNLQIEAIGRIASSAGAGTPAFTDSPTPRLHECGIYLHPSEGSSFPLAGTLVPDVHNWSLEINNNLRRRGSANGDGIRGIRKPIPNGYRSIALKFGKDWDADTYQDIWKQIGSGGFVAAEARITSEFEVAGGGGSDFYSGSYRLPAAEVDGNQPPFGGDPGPLPEEIVMEAGVWIDGGSGANIAQVVLGNTEATLA